jgi:dTDP-4-amino-4,6-dideoxygalactose transaminase
MSDLPALDVPFHVASIGEREIAAVTDVLRSGWLTTGEHCRAFERSFGELLGPDVHAVAVNSGTAALHLALEAVGIGPGDLVVTSAYTFTATAAVVRHLGARLVFADVDPATGNLTPSTVRRALAGLTPRERGGIKALVPVHFAGLACDMTGLVRLAADHGWSVVDDAAHALPSSHDGEPIGRWGDATAFSFYATKTLCTGEGGMLTTRNAELAERARTMRLHGIDRDVFDRYTQRDAWRYEVVAHGFKVNMTDLAAALGRVQLARLEEMREARRTIAETYDAAFGELAEVALPAHAAPGDEHAHHLYPLRVLEGRAVRDELIRQLAADGIGTSVHFIPLPLHRAWAGESRTPTPGALELFEQEVSLPLFPDMTEGQVEQVVSALPSALRRSRRRCAS